MALDQASTDLLAYLAEGGGRPFYELTPEEARAVTAAAAAMYGAGPAMARVWEQKIEGDSSLIPVRVLVPTEKPRGILVYYHGGGWVVGALGEYETLGRVLAERTDCTVLLVDYRLAPENPYPAAVNDAWYALAWADEHRAALAHSAAPLIVAGDSSGANLATVVARRARQEDGPGIALQVLVYPVTDSDFDTPSYLDSANQLMLERATMRWFWNHYLPTVAERHDPDASPLRAEDLSGLPPALVLTAEYDVLRDEGEAYAERLKASGVPVELHRMAGQMHGFFTMPNVLPGSAQAVELIGRAVDACFA